MNSKWNGEPMIKIGLIGLGGFGRFCLQTFETMAEVKVAAVAENDETQRHKLEGRLDIKSYHDAKDLIHDKELDLVHIITPPYSHYPLAIRALEQGKHVLCEKPLALNIQDAETLLNKAKLMKRLIPVNLVLRYVPLSEKIRQLISEETLGKPLRAYFENYATDARLPSDHWFWDKQKSGGIFVEHGVHFFDLYRSWFGDGTVIWAVAQTRVNTTQEDRVLAAIRYENGLLATHYHGFDQPQALDRQRHRILFEHGDVIIEGWIPYALQLCGLVNERLEAKLNDLFPRAHIQTVKNTAPSDGLTLKGNGQNQGSNKMIRLEYREDLDKETLYRNAIADLLRDQIESIGNPNHRRKVTETNGVYALREAKRASMLAKTSGEDGSDDE